MKYRISDAGEKADKPVLYVNLCAGIFDRSVLHEGLYSGAKSSLS